MVISRKLLHSQTLYLEPRHNTIATSNEINFLYLEVRSRSNVMVKGHRRGGVTYGIGADAKRICAVRTDAVWNHGIRAVAIRNHEIWTDGVRIAGIGNYLCVKKYNRLQQKTFRERKLLYVHDYEYDTLAYLSHRS